MPAVFPAIDVHVFFFEYHQHNIRQCNNVCRFPIKIALAQNECDPIYELMGLKTCVFTLHACIIMVRKEKIDRKTSSYRNRHWDLEEKRKQFRRLEHAKPRSEIE